MEQIKKAKRNVGVEQLRALAMFMIVFAHLLYHETENMELTGVNGVISKFFFGAGDIAVSMFILISGYFSINSVKVNKERTLKLVLQTIFYATAIYFISVIFGIQTFRIRSVIDSLLPFISGSTGYWFIPCYVLLVFTTPFLNRALKNTPQKQLKILLLLYFFNFSIMKPLFSPFVRTQEYTMVSNMSWFIFVYCIGAYIRLYKPSTTYNRKALVTWLIIALCLLFGTNIITYYNLLPTGGLVGKGIKVFCNLFGFVDRTAFMTIVIAIPVFCLFLTSDATGEKLWTKIGASTLGVYLIHENGWISKYIWSDIIPAQRWFACWYYLFIALFFAFVIFVIGILIDMLRIILLEKPLFKNKTFRNIIGLDYKER